MEDAFFIIFLLTIPVLTAVIAHYKGRNVLGWLLVGLIFGIFGVILVAVLPNVKTEQAEKQRMEMENRRLREQLYQERVKGESFRQHTVARLDQHDNQLGVDTRGATALPDGDHPNLLEAGGNEEASDASPTPAAVPPAPAAPPRLWYYELGGQTNGPVTTPQLMDLVRESRVNGTTLVWSEGMTDWVLADEVPEIRRQMG